MCEWLLSTRPGRAAVTALTNAQQMAVKRPTPDLVDRGFPGNPNGPLVVNYARDDPKPARIGRYSSISDRCYLFLSGTHHSDFVTTFNFWDTHLPQSHFAYSKGAPVIGSDVLVNFDAIVLSGVTIGHGAIVAARAVVRQDVQPYEVVGGVPARHIRWRFDQPTREALLRIAWWDWTHEKVKRHVEQLACPDVAGFIARHDPDSAHREPCPQC